MPQVTIRRFVLCALFSCGLPALADGPPSPHDQNHSGGFAGPSLTFGQSRSTGAKNPGVAWFLGVEGGYVAAHQEWNRMEMSLELGTGQATFTDQNEKHVNLPIPVFALAKFGYGYTIGANTLGVIRVGVGPATGTYPGSAIESGGGSESILGFMGLLGYDVVLPVSKSFEMVAGIEDRMVSYSGDRIKSFQLNIPELNVGFRIRL